VLGIREQNIPSQAQFSVLVDFVKTQLGKYTIEEFKTAVQMAVAKKLEINANTYQNLNCVFISELMSAYDSHIRRAGFRREEQQNLLMLNDKPKQVTKEDKEACNALFADSVLLKHNDFKISCEKTGVPYFEYVSAMYNLFYRNYNFHSKEQITEIKKLKFAVMVEKYKDKLQDSEFIKFKNNLEKDNKYTLEWTKMCRVHAFEEILNNAIENEKLIVL